MIPDDDNLSSIRLIKTQRVFTKKIKNKKWILENTQLLGNFI